MRDLWAVAGVVAALLVLQATHHWMSERRLARRLERHRRRPRPPATHLVEMLDARDAWRRGEITADEADRIIMGRGR
jgi:hypothetical protein